jgi:hypothetical protein
MYEFSRGMYGSSRHSVVNLASARVTERIGVRAAHRPDVIAEPTSSGDRGQALRDDAAYGHFRLARRRGRPRQRLKPVEPSVYGSPRPGQLCAVRLLRNFQSAAVDPKPAQVQANPRPPASISPPNGPKRRMYRELSPLLDVRRDKRSLFEARLALLRACEASVERLVTDHDYFARPARTIFTDIRWQYPVCRQDQIYRVVERHMALVAEFVATIPRNGVDADGNPLQCRATTRRGTACERAPLPKNGYCPSHQHLAETENCEVHTLAA